MVMDSRTRLVEATQDLLWEQGYSATSPKDIMRRSGAGQGSMYHHFTNKQELALVALECSAQSMRQDAEKLLATDGSAYEIATAYLRRQRDVLKGCRMGRMTFDADVLNTPELIEPVKRTFVWLLEALTALFERGRDQGEFAADIDARNLASLVVATVQGGYVLARATRDTDAFDAAVEGAAALLHKATVPLTTEVSDHSE